MIFISHRHPLVTVIHNFKIQFISVLTTTAVRCVLVKKAFYVTVLLCSEWYNKFPSYCTQNISKQTGTHPQCCAISFLCTCIPVNLEILNKLHSNMKNTVFCNMMVYSLVRIYFYFARTSSLLFHSRRVCRTAFWHRNILLYLPWRILSSGMWYWNISTCQSETQFPNPQDSILLITSLPK